MIFDSTRTDHWGVAGYARDTTPVMSRWVAQGDARWHRGVAGAAATRASMALLLNGVREPGHLEQLRSHRGNLFGLAKQAGYRTYWLSTQYGGDLLEDQDKASIDVTRIRETDPERVAAVGDDAIIDMLAPLKPGEPRLIVLLLRTAHIPYEDAYRRRATPPPQWPDTASSSSEQSKIDAYDHAIAYQDDLVGRLYQRFEALDEQGLFVVTSDHGQ
ncbi:sulfatase-like hydrolase/transferase, partial [Lysobacter sp. 2RAB21]